MAVLVCPMWTVNTANAMGRRPAEHAALFVTDTLVPFVGTEQAPDAIRRRVAVSTGVHSFHLLSLQPPLVSSYPMYSLL